MNSYFTLKMLHCVIFLLILREANAFVPPVAPVPSTILRPMSETAASHSLFVVDPSSTVEVIQKIGNSLLVSETQAWVQPTASFLDPFLNFLSFAMLARVVLSWYPNTNLKELPWVLVVVPTEPLLKAVRGAVPPAFGVDITPIVWLGLFTFIHEILLGQQGLLTLKLKYGI
jgi:YggT family protein